MVNPHSKLSHPSQTGGIDDSAHFALLAILAANPDSSLRRMWSPTDANHWEGVRIEGGIVTGL